MDGTEESVGSGLDGSTQGVDIDRLLDDVRRRVHGVVDERSRLRHLLDAVVSIAADLSLDGVLTRIVEASGSLTGAQYAALGVLSDGPERHLRTFIHHGMDTDVVMRIGDLPTGRGLLDMLIDDPRPIRLRDIAAHPASFGFPENHPPMTSFLGVPLRTRDGVFGNLYLTEKTDGEEFTELDESIAMALASAAGVAIENAALHEQAASRQAWLEATTETVALLAEDGAGVSALQVVADRARSVSGADVTWVVSGSGPADLRLEVVSGAPVDLDALRALPMHQSLASIVVRTGTAISVEDVAADPRAVDPSSVKGWPRLGPVMVLPLRSSTGVEGALALGWTPDHAERFLALDPVLPASFAEQATLALQVARSREDRQRLSLYDDRDRIGRDLHDLVIQRLFAVGLGLHSAAEDVADEQIACRLRRAVDDLDDTISDIRRTIFALGAMDAASDLQSEIEGLVDRAAVLMKFRPRVQLDGPIRTTVPDELAPDLLAVLSEALTNVSRHAHATSVDVRVKVHDHALEMCVSDDGRGMEDEILESGLANMRTRATSHGGELRVDSGSGSGTTVTWRVPIPRGR